jgi:hypothetical protein
MVVVARVAVAAALCVVCAPRGASGAGAPRYVLHPLALPVHTGIAATGYGDSVTPASIVRDGPRTIALAANGAVAIVAGDDGGQQRPKRIVVWRADGSRAILGLPSAAVLRETFGHRADDTAPFPAASFARVVLANDGTPFATVENVFSGAYSGIERGIVRWSGTTWKSVRIANSDWAPRDHNVVSAELPALRVGITADSSRGFVTGDEVERDPESLAPRALLYDGSALRKLGTGTLTALAQTYACGFIGERDGRAMPDNVNVDSQTPYALLWHEGATKRLGRGIAFAVNASGIAVGDDRSSVTGNPLLASRAEYDRFAQIPGAPRMMLPMRWDAHGGTALATEPGTAFAIAPDRTIAGALARGDGFVVRDGIFRTLDALVAGAHAHIRGAYAINVHGRILVLTGPGASLAYLDPSSP